MTTDPYDREYVKNLENVVSTRTEQLRQAFSVSEQLLKCLKQIQTMHSLDEVKTSVQAAIQKFESKIVAEPPKFGGEPGEPVPEVDPDDVKALWQMGRDVGEHGAIGGHNLEAACKPGANVQATSYRAGQLSLIRHYAPEVWTRLTDNGEPHKAVFHAAAKVPMDWMGVGVVRQGPPFNFDEFVRRCDSLSK